MRGYGKLHNGKTRAEALTHSASHPLDMYFPTDATTIIVNKKEYGVGSSDNTCGGEGGCDCPDMQQLQSTVEALTADVRTVHDTFFLNCNREGDRLVSDFIPAKAGDKVTWKAYCPDGSWRTTLRMYDASRQFISGQGWSTAVAEREVTIDNSQVAFVRAFFQDDRTTYQYLKLNGVLVAHVAKSDYAKDVDELNRQLTYTPDFVMAEAMTTWKRLLAWSDGSKTFLLAHITDVHSGGNDKWRHVGYLDSLDTLFGFSALVNGGDTGLDAGISTTEDEDYQLLFSTKQCMSTGKPWIFCKGNHERQYPSALYGSIFNMPTARRTPGFVLGDNGGCYGYYDETFNSIRVIFLNTTDADIGSHYGMTADQLKWLVKALLSTPSGWRVVVTCHFMPHSIGAWTSGGGSVDLDAFKCLRQMLSDFVTRKNGKYTALGVTWDFSAVQSALVCLLTGDSHFNNYVQDNGVNYIVRQGYGGVSDSNMPVGSTKDVFNVDRQCLFDVLSIKDGGEAKLFRIGAGGDERDLEMTFFHGLFVDNTITGRAYVAAANIIGYASQAGSWVTITSMLKPIVSGVSVRHGSTTVTCKMYAMKVSNEADLDHYYLIGIYIDGYDKALYIRQGSTGAYVGDDTTEHATIYAGKWCGSV